MWSTILFLMGVALTALLLYYFSGNKAESDHEFDSGSKISSVDIGEERLEDLVILAKVWGFLKYYHPSVRNGDFNMDYELFRVIPKIQVTHSKAERNKVLVDFIDRFGPVSKRILVKSQNNKVRFQPDLRWIDSSILGDTVHSKLTNIRNLKRSNDSYYVEQARAGNPIIKNESAYNAMNYTDVGYRLLSLFRYWNIIHYLFPYKHLIKEDWNEVLSEFIPKFVNAQTELEYKKVLLSLIAKVQDTHANIWSYDSTLEYWRGLNYAPFFVEFIEGELVVTQLCKQPEVKVDKRIQIGTIVRKINGKAIPEIIRQSLEYLPASNYAVQLRDLAYQILRTNNSYLDIEFSTRDSIYSARISCYTSQQIEFDKHFTKTDTCFRQLENGISYLYAGTLKSNHLKKLLPIIMKSKGLIIDYRWYPADFLVFRLGAHLLNEEKPFVQFYRVSISEPGAIIMHSTSTVGEMNSEAFEGKVVLLVNENTQSSAEYHVMAFKTIPRALVIGSTTAGADGNVSRFNLPGGIKTMISGIGVCYPNGTETQQVGIIPDIFVTPSIQGTAEGRDEVLEMAIMVLAK